MNVFQRRGEDRPPRRMRKGLYLLPSLFTTANLAAGYYAISQAVIGSVEGTVALQRCRHRHRLCRALRRHGRRHRPPHQYHQRLRPRAGFPGRCRDLWRGPGYARLDVGLPATSAGARCYVARARIIQFGAIASFIFLAAGAARLARFNIAVNPQPANPGRPGRKYFVGMPIPGGAGCIAAMVHLVQGDPIEKWGYAILWIAAVAIAGISDGEPMAILEREKH